MFVEEKEVGEEAKLDEATKLLLKAADVLERHGLAKGIRCDGLGSHCVLGAIDVAAGYDPDFGEGDDEKSDAWKSAVRRLSDALPLMSHLGSNWNAAEWNNAPERSQFEVVSKLRAVALGG